MKKKKIIVVVLIIAILGVTAVLGWGLYETNKVFEIDPLEMYGELDYLGPMEEEVEPLMEEEIKELNPISFPSARCLSTNCRSSVSSKGFPLSSIWMNLQGRSTSSASEISGTG